MNLRVDRRGQGPDLVLLHGWALHSGAWDELMPTLSARFRVHALDLPGHGDSPAAAESFDAAVDSLASMVPKGSIVCGWSLGGLVAQGIASRHPQRVRKLMLVGTTPCFRAHSDWDAAMADDTLAQFATGLRDDRVATLASFVRLNAFHGVRSREAIRAFSRKLGEREPASLASLEATLSWLREVDLRTEAQRIIVETVVLHGTRDMLAPIAAGRWLAKTLPNARLVEIADCAHLPFFTHADEFVRALESLS